MYNYENSISPYSNSVWSHQKIPSNVNITRWNKIQSKGFMLQLTAGFSSETKQCIGYPPPPGQTNCRPPIVFKTTKIHWDIFCRSPGAVLQSHITCPSVVAKSGGYNFIETIIFAFHSIDVPSACFSAPGQIFWHSLKFFCMSAVEKSGVSLLIYT